MTADLIGYLSDLFFLPGNVVLRALIAHAAPIATFIGASEYGGVLSVFISSVVWIAAFIAVAIAYRAVIDFDRRVTFATKRLFSTLMLRLRIARVLELKDVPRREPVCLRHDGGRQE